MPGLTPDFANEYSITQARNPAALTSDTNSSGIDLRDCGPSVCVILEVGAVTGTSPTLTVTAQTSTNDNTADAEAAADAYASLSATATSVVSAALTDADANSQVIFQFHNRDKRYVRLNFDVGGTNPSFLIGATVISKKVSY